MIVALVVLGLAAIVLAGLLWCTTQGVLMRRRRRRVVVTLKSGESFAGVLVEAREALVLRQTEALGDNRASVPVDGEVLILRSDVSFIQVP